MKRIILSVMPEEIRMALIDDKNQLIDYMVERPESEHIANHIFKGCVRNVLPGMQAAFVDIGREQNAYLNLQQGKQTKSLGKLYEGQQILVQVVKEEMLGKGARVTADISLAGRFMVLLPFSEGLHISKKISDPSLRQALTRMAEPYTSHGCGFILRTAAAKATETEVLADMEFLWQTWNSIMNRFKIAKGATRLYSDADFWYRIIRDYVKSDVEEIIVDDKVAYDRIIELLNLTKLDVQVAPILYTDKMPLFKNYDLDPQIENLTNAEVALPSGGTVRIDHTEALTVIDINSGHFIGKSKSAEDMALTVNKEAAHEICRQLRLRDIGGIIVCDFIDMRRKEHQAEILDLLMKLARTDKVKTVVCGISSLGLVEMTRKRERKGLQSILFDTCNQCGGTGYIFSSQTVYLQIKRRLREMQQAGRLRTGIEIECHPDVAAHFTKAVLKEFSKELQKEIRLISSKEMSLEAYSLLSLND